MAVRREAALSGGASYPTVRRSRPGKAWRVLRAVAPWMLAGATLLGAIGCTTTPVTGRRAFNLFTPAQDLELGRAAYGQILAGLPLVTSGPELAMVQRAMQRLSAVADDAGYEWEVRLIDDPNTVNAFALPGGKMAVYTGILPVCQDETGLSVVMGHEIGHVVAQHGTERMSRSSVIDTLLGLADLGDYEQAAQVGRTYLIDLPFSREHESEADEIGIIYMARAGYDPRAAPRFWERMAALSGGGPPELLSTHPSSSTRAQRLEALLPRALSEWRGAGGGP